MAKAPAPTKTRLLTTVNARYYPVEGVADAYCLDGKFPGKRELRAANMTMDREGRGFLVSVFAYPSDARDRLSSWQEPLKKLSDQISAETGDIDSDINDLAETALDVTGGLKLADDMARPPYFSGIIVRDGELAAVTVGEGLAFIYRQEVLYPLTGHSKSLEAMDLYGDPVEGIEDFIAGEAGAIRYSNIAQVEAGDIFFLCNGDLFDVIGQKEVMQLLADSEDQMDAAGLILTAAASQMPGTPIQLVVSKVEDLKTGDQASKFSLGRFATQAMEPVVLPSAQTEDPALGRTQRYERQDMIDRAGRESVAREDKEKSRPSWDLPPLPVSEATEPFEAVAPRMDLGYDPDPYDNLEDSASQATPGPKSYGEADYFSRPGEEETGGQLPVFAYSTAAQKRSRQQQPAYENYDQGQDLWDTGDDLEGSRPDYDPYGDYDGFEDDRGYGRKPRKGGSDKTRRLVFYAILIAIIIICIVALIKLVFGGNKTPATEPSISESVSVPTDPPPSTTTTTPTETEPTDTESPNQVHIVVANDTWWGICMRYYDRASESLCAKLAEYNDMSVNNLFVGNELEIPPLSELLGD